MNIKCARCDNLAILTQNRFECSKCNIIYEKINYKASIGTCSRKKEETWYPVKGSRDYKPRIYQMYNGKGYNPYKVSAKRQCKECGGIYFCFNCVSYCSRECLYLSTSKEKRTQLRKELMITDNQIGKKEKIMKELNQIKEMINGNMKKELPIKQESIKGFNCKTFYENMLDSTLGRMPDIQWNGDPLKDKIRYQKVIKNMEKRRQLINMFYNSTEWKEKRAEILKRDDFTCQICGKKGLDVQVHHINSAIYNPEMCLDNDNLKSVCDKCHI